MNESTIEPAADTLPDLASDTAVAAADCSRRIAMIEAVEKRCLLATRTVQRLKRRAGVKDAEERRRRMDELEAIYARRDEGRAFARDQRRLLARRVIKRLRDLGMTQEGIGWGVGMTQQAISNIELRGRAPTATTLRCFASLLEMQEGIARDRERASA